MHPFHIAIPVNDLKKAETFYGQVLGCATGRRAERWIDFDFFGHQLSVHEKPEEVILAKANIVDGKDVPVRHFGVILPWQEWHALAGRMQAAGTAFIIAPYIRFEGQVGEQATMFFPDPSGNMLEFKSFRDPSQIFAQP